jgi:hypothetical protein
VKKRTLSAGPRIVFPRCAARGLGPRSRRGTSSVEWCARRFSGPERLRTTSATIPARFRAVPNSLVRNSADARAHPFERFDPRPQYRARRLGLRSRASPVSRRAFGEPDASIVGSPSLPFPAGEPELHDPPLRVGRMQMGEETRVKDCRTSRRFPSSMALFDARVTDPSWCGIWRSPPSRQTGLRPPSNASPRRQTLSEGSRHLSPFRNPRVVGRWLSRARLDQLSFTPLASSEHCFGQQRLLFPPP